MRPIIVALLYLIIWNSTKAQTSVNELQIEQSKLYVLYTSYDGYINDSIYNDTQNQALFIGNKASIYVYQSQTPEEFLEKLRSRSSFSDRLDREESIESFKRHFDVNKIVTQIIVKYNQAPDFLTHKNYNQMEKMIKANSMDK